jgi:hypothetical protein
MLKLKSIATTTCERLDVVLEEDHFLRLAVIEDGEIRALEVGHESAGVIEHGGQDRNDAGAAAESRLLLRADRGSGEYDERGNGDSTHSSSLTIRARRVNPRDGRAGARTR